MQRTYTKPADSKESRPKTAGEMIIEDLKKDYFLNNQNKRNEENANDDFDAVIWK